MNARLISRYDAYGRKITVKPNTIIKRGSLWNKQLSPYQKNSLTGRKLRSAVQRRSDRKIAAAAKRLRIPCPVTG